MKPRQIRENVYWMGAVDWDRRLFDSLIPLPDGTSYNAYLVEGSEKTALMDTVDPNKADVLLSQLQDVAQVDYVVAHHAEQDHSGSIPQVLARYENAQVVVTPKAKEMLIDLLSIPADRFLTVEDGQTLSLGRQDPRVRLHSLGALARDHGDLAAARPHPLHVRFLWLAPGDHRPILSPTRRAYTRQPSATMPRS